MAVSGSGGMNFGGEPSDNTPASAPPVEYGYRATASYTAVESRPFAKICDESNSDDGGSKKKCCCCCTMLFSPFRCANWLLVLFNLFVTVTFGWFASLWSLNTFAVGVAFLLFFPVGPLLMMAWVISWRYLGRLEIMIQSAVVGDRISSKYRTIPVCNDPSIHQAINQNWCSCNGFWTAFKLVVLDREAWSALAYFSLVKLPLTVFVLAWIMLFVAVPIILMFNFVLLSACGTCYGPDNDMGGSWGHWDHTKWLFNTYKGSAVTVPVGFVMLCLGLHTLRRVSESSARLALNLLASRADDSRDHSPLLAVSVRHDGM